MADLIQIRRDTKAHWAEVNPVLAPGEPGLETDTRKVKHGDGTTAWNDLPYGDIIDINTTTGTDLDIADEYGNVLMRIANGHIKTKKFDSAKIPDLIAKTITDKEMDDVLGEDVAVYLTDVNGNAVLDDNGKPIEII